MEEKWKNLMMKWGTNWKRVKKKQLRKEKGNTSWELVQDRREWARVGLLIQYAFIEGEREEKGKENVKNESKWGKRKRNHFNEANPVRWFYLIQIKTDTSLAVRPHIVSETLPFH